MSGTLYMPRTDSEGNVHYDNAVAYYENGKVYTASDSYINGAGEGSLIAEYENGVIYRVFASKKGRRKAIACFEYGRIHTLRTGILGRKIKMSPCAEVVGGNISDIRKSFTARYDGDSEGAAAAAAVMLLGLSENESDTGNIIPGIIGGFIPERNERGSYSASAVLKLVAYGLLALVILLVIIVLLPVLLVGALVFIIVYRLTRSDKDDASSKRTSIEIMSTEAEMPKEEPKDIFPEERVENPEVTSEPEKEKDLFNVNQAEEFDMSFDETVRVRRTNAGKTADNDVFSDMAKELDASDATIRIRRADAVAKATVPETSTSVKVSRITSTMKASAEKSAEASDSNPEDKRSSDTMSDKFKMAGDL